MRIKSPAQIATGMFVVLIAAAGSASAESASMLLGKWQLTSEKQDSIDPGSHCQKTGMLFTPSAEAWIQGGQNTSERVLGYEMSGTDVHVTDMGGVDAYTVIDHNHIQYNQMKVACIYTRAK